MKTFNFNQNCSEDDEVYCISHVPKVSPGKLDGDALGIQAALNVPKSVILVNEQIRRHPESAKGRVECLEDHSAAELNQNILTCDNLEILCDSRGDFKIENEFDDTTSPSISSRTSSLSSVISSSSSIDEMHYKMRPISFAIGAVIKQENEELDLNENLDAKVVATPELITPKNDLSFEDIYCQTLTKLPIGWIDATEVLEKESTNPNDEKNFKNENDFDFDTSSPSISSGSSSLSSVAPPELSHTKNVLPFEDIYCQTLMKLPIGKKHAFREIAQL